MDHSQINFVNVADGKWIEYGYNWRKRYQFTEIKRYYNDDGLVIELSKVYKMYLKLTSSKAYLAESWTFGVPFIDGSWTYDIIKNISKYRYHSKLAYIS